MNIEHNATRQNFSPGFLPVSGEGNTAAAYWLAEDGKK